tara:strand:+ start:13410 stop:14588 length:1179 start_codon:yes stop_codon:yes gene_type:complete
MDKFYNLNLNQDKSQSSSTHKSMYFKDPGKLSLSIDDISSEKKNFSNINDLKIIDKIITGLKDNKLPFRWTIQEDFFLNNISQIRKKIEYLIYRYKFKIYPENQVLEKFPLHVLIEPASICNLRCVMCYQVDKTFTGDNIKKNSNKNMMGMMNMDLFKKIIDECSNEDVKAVSLGSRGEPMLNKNFSEMLSYISSKDNFFDVKINSNGTALNEKICHSILKSKVNILVISCDANTEDLYKRIRVGGNFEKLLNNIKLLTSIRKKEYPNSKLEIRISGVYFHEEQNPAEFNKFWEDKVDTVSFVKVQNRWDTYNNQKNLEKNNPCDFLWEKIYVWWDGTTNPCDEDYKSLLSPGNIKDQSIKDLWNNNKLNELRKLHKDNKRITKIPCDRCNV